MGFRIKLRSFRCFRETPWVTVRPLTLLIGANSSGKSSFLAATRYLLNSLSGSASASFNQDPFFLGAYDQIAHFRGGKAGRARSFELGIEIDSNFGRPSSRTMVPSVLEVVLHFASSSGQPVNCGASISHEKTRLLAEFGAHTRITLTDPDTQQLALFDEISRDETFNLDRFTFDNLKYVLADLGMFSRQARRGEKEDKQSENEPLRRGTVRAEQIGRQLRTLSNRLSRGVVAGAPVRTKPERIYQPIEETTSTEGSHIPLVLARMKGTNAVEWERLKDALDKFGRAAGLFDDITIKRLGKNISDPFQVFLKTNGPSSNLIDVGYGVSQVLPLVTELLRETRRRVFLYQQPEVHLHPSAQAQLGSFLAETVAQRNHTLIVETHSDYIVDRVRMDVRDANVLSPRDVMILYFERDGLDTSVHEITLDEQGHLLNAPPGYRGFFVREQIRSLSSRD